MYPVQGHVTSERFGSLHAGELTWITFWPNTHFGYRFQASWGGGGPGRAKGPPGPPHDVLAAWAPYERSLVTHVKKGRSVGKSDTVSAPDGVEKQTMKRVAARLVLLLFVVYILNYIDRPNIALAKDDMSASIGSSELAHGLGQGSSSSVTPCSKFPATWCCIASVRDCGSLGSWLRGGWWRWRWRWPSYKARRASTLSVSCSARPKQRLASRAIRCPTMAEPVNETAATRRSVTAPG